MFDGGARPSTRPLGRRSLGEAGASLVEYALLLALIAMICVGAVAFLGSRTADDVDANTSSLFIR